MPTSTANVVTDRPGRYTDQLYSHLGRKATATRSGDEGLVVFDFGTCTLRTEPGQLTLIATAADEETLQRVQDVAGGHLERFGTRDELAVSWHDGQAPSS